MSNSVDSLSMTLHRFLNQANTKLHGVHCDKRRQEILFTGKTKQQWCSCSQVKAVESRSAEKHTTESSHTVSLKVFLVAREEVNCQDSDMRTLSSDSGSLNTTWLPSQPLVKCHAMRLSKLRKYFLSVSSLFSLCP